MNEAAQQIRAPGETAKPPGFFARRRRLLACLILIALCSTVFGAWYLSPVPRANRTFACVGLAKLPESAYDLKLGVQAPTCVTARYVMFRADPADINDFLQSSPALKDLIPQEVAVGYRRTPSKDVPWFRIEMAGPLKGLRYDITFEKARALLVIDRTTCTVYFRFSKPISWWYRKLRTLRFKLR